MKLKLKQGKDLVDSFIFSKRHDNDLIVNLVDRWTYKDFKQKKNQFIIDTDKGKIVFVFVGEVYQLEFKWQEKDQLIFNVIKT